jgi:hypothetical protein
VGVKTLPHGGKFTPPTKIGLASTGILSTPVPAAAPDKSLNKPLLSMP